MRQGKAALRSLGFFARKCEGRSGPAATNGGVTMQRESEVIARIVQDIPAWKRIGRLTPEAAGTDPVAASIFVLGLAVVVAVCAAAQ
jgi:hypothetical protein